MLFPQAVRFNSSMESDSDCTSQNNSKSLECNLNSTLSFSRPKNIEFENSTYLNENITPFDITENLNDEEEITTLAGNDPTKLLKKHERYECRSNYHCAPKYKLY